MRTRPIEAWCDLNTPSTPSKPYSWKPLITQHVSDEPPVEGDFHEKRNHLTLPSCSGCGDSNIDRDNFLDDWLISTWYRFVMKYMRDEKMKKNPSHKRLVVQRYNSKPIWRVFIEKQWVSDGILNLELFLFKLRLINIYNV